ncbi:hypothetical protein OH77DRAFT_474646 [Trametes cingulata]|nr:hypothetical protein OH77DRAFT_474646 [Trametes cingulata]
MTTTLRTILHAFTHKVVFRMALLLWGFAWLSLSVLIFVAGRIIPQLQPKPPPLALKVRSPRVRSLPASPIVSPPKSIASEPAEQEPDELTSYDSSLTSPAQPAFPPTPPPAPARTPPPKRKWSLNTHFFSGRSAPSPKSSLFSAGSSNGSGTSSPPRFFPELPIVESASPTSELGCREDAGAGSSRSTPTGSPRANRGMRLPGAKMLRSLSRRMSAKQPKSDAASTRSESPTAPHSREGSFECEPAAGGSRVQTRRRASTTEVPTHTHAQARPGHLLHYRNHSLPGEVFTTTFVNPFKAKSKSKARKAQTPPAIDLSEPISPSPRRSSAPRRMLTSIQHALTSSTTSASSSGARSRSDSQSQSQSRRSSMSSTSTGVSALSAPSVLSGSSGSPRSVPRTQPYAAPYFAAMPRSSGRGSGAGPAKEGREGREAREARLGSSRRASSLSPPRRPETVAEESAEDCEHVSPAAAVAEREVGVGEGEGEHLSALGLKLGQLGHGRPKWQQRQSRQRVAVSEGAVAASTAPGRVLGMSEIALGVSS